ncbi:MAG: hypothetical protein K9M75_11455 [Phycisphaerae bacterium]|nr:hypothetical protein [Phycisphaerae bacterium]
MAIGYFCPECEKVCDKDGFTRKNNGEGRRYTEKDFDEILNGEDMCRDCWKEEEGAYCNGDCDSCSYCIPGEECRREII